MQLLKNSLYVGEYRHNMDSKNRLTIPAKWRFSGDDTESVYLALPNPVGCITVYPPKMLERLNQKVSEVSLGDRNAQKALTRLFSKADHFGCDKQGRINLSEGLSVHGGLEKEVVLVGNFATFSLWEPERYLKYLSSEDIGGDDEMSKILKELGV